MGHRPGVSSGARDFEVLLAGIFGPPIALGGGGMMSEQNSISTATYRIPPPTVAITRRETLSFPIELSSSSGGVVGYSKTIVGDRITVRCVWSGRLADLSTDRRRVERELAKVGFADGARIGDASIYVGAARLVDDDGISVAPMFIPSWSVDLRMNGDTLLLVGGCDVIRMAVPESGTCVPTEKLDRVSAAYDGRAPWTVTASSELTIHELDAAVIARSQNPRLELDVIVRAIAVPHAELTGITLTKRR